ncbi:MAG: hypothetical protein PHY54_00045 [Methylococcales bacterium]|nr:hypothetical protein [Methylococcales bacterium]
MPEFNSYNDLANLLKSLDFIKFYNEKIRKRNYVVNYGNRKGKLEFESVISAAEKYNYKANVMYTVGIDKQLEILNKLDSIDDNKLVLQCIEIFDWGGVQKSNIITAIDLHRKNKLKSYLLECKEWFENDNTLKINVSDLIWSSGWTKVYSFMFSKTTIYDSRVAAFINYILVCFYRSLLTEEKKEALLIITQKLVSFTGTENRARCVCASDMKLLGIKMKSNEDKLNFIANKVASWLLRYITEIEFPDQSQSQSNFRRVDKAMFMLGFDIAQIDAKAGFSCSKTTKQAGAANFQHSSPT